jgi:hypothetical protein
MKIIHGHYEKVTIDIFLIVVVEDNSGKGILFSDRCEGLRPMRWEENNG